ncbi:MAG: porin [Pseudomonadales bacterium]|nr:porin [Pseudomonadales bacterium]
MKRNLIALAVAAAVIAPVANAAPKVYGKINLSAESYKKEDESKPTADIETTQMTSNASRFGVKGEDELTANISAIYGIEWEVSGEGDAADLGQRNRFLGLKHQSLGTVKMGKYDSYTKLAQGSVDLFNDYAGDMKYTIAGENRLNNVLGYESPKFMNTEFNVMAQTQDAAANGTSLSIVHNNEELGLYLALAMDNNVEGKGATITSTAAELDSTRLVATYKVADLTLNALYSMTENEVSKEEETAYLIGAAYKMGDVELKAQYSVADNDTNNLANGKTSQKTLTSIGADYKLSSKAKVFGWYSMKEQTKVGLANDVTEDTLGLGIEHKF